MEVKEFLKTYQRMCEKTNCDDCPMAYECCDLGSNDCDIDKVVPIVEEWSKEHPLKTRQSEFLKMFPEAAMEMGGGVIAICPMLVSEFYRDEDNHTCGDCYKCHREFWLEEIE